jgi:hypothetical protein
VEIAIIYITGFWISAIIYRIIFQKFASIEIQDWTTFDSVMSTALSVVLAVMWPVVTILLVAGLVVNGLVQLGRKIKFESKAH